MSCACSTRGVHAGGGCVRSDTAGVVPASGSGFWWRGGYKEEKKGENILSPDVSCSQTHVPQLTTGGTHLYSFQTFDQFSKLLS